MCRWHVGVEDAARRAQAHPAYLSDPWSRVLWTGVEEAVPLPPPAPVICNDSPLLLA